MITTKDILRNDLKPNELAMKLYNKRNNIPQDVTEQPIYNNEPLTLYDFKLIRKNSHKWKNQNNNVTVGEVKNKQYNQLCIKLYPWHIIYGVVSTEFNRVDIKTGDSFVPAPSIEQWYQQLLVSTDDLNIDIPDNLTQYKRYDYIHKAVNNKTLTYDNIKPKTIQNINNNFNQRVSNDTNIFKKRCKNKPVGFIYDDHIIDAPLSRRLYGQLYQRQIMEDEESRDTFIMLHELCINRDRRHPIIICSPFITDGLIPQQININDKNTSYISAKLLIEMLINYPNLDNCEWNK